MNKLVLDFETYFDANITLKKLNYTEYVAATSVMCASYILDDAEPVCLSGEELASELSKLNWTNTELICHNAAFDTLILKHHYGIVPARIVCTLACSRLLHHTLPHNLADLATALGLPGHTKQHQALLNVKGKAWNALTPDEQDQLGDYCINDTVLTQQLYDLLWPQVCQTERDIIDHTFKLWLKPTLVLDAAMAQAALDEERTETERLIAESGLSKTAIRSDAQFSAYLTSKGYQPPTKISAKKQCEVPAFSKTDEAFACFYEENPELHTLLDLKRRINSNIKESRTERLISSSKVYSNRIPVCYNYCGAFTGRFSGSNSINLQNLPRGSVLRSSITAPPGETLIVCDLSQVEARLTAWFCEEEEILDIFRSKRDMYCEVATGIFGKPITKADKHERFCGKSAALGLNYGMGAERFQAWCKQSGASLTLDFCQDVVKKYRSNFPNIPATWDALNKNIFKLKNKQIKHPMANNIAYTKPTWIGKVLPISLNPNKLTLPSGRVLNYGNVVSSETGGLRIDKGRFIHGSMLLENIIQALSRDILVEQILEAEKYYPVVMHTHDEIVWSVPSHKALEAKEQLLAIMRNPPKWAPTLPLDAEAGIGQRFSECK